MVESSVKSVAIIGAGASGAITAAAFAAEQHYAIIKVFERRESAGGTWIYDPDPNPAFKPVPGALPTEIDPALEIPDSLPSVTSPTLQERHDKTPIYADLTTNVPDIAMSFSDLAFSYGPFTPHWVPRQYIEHYFSYHKIDSNLVLNTTVEDVSRLPSPAAKVGAKDRWQLTLRRYDAALHRDSWWQEQFDAVIIANGHYAIPFVPQVVGLTSYISSYPERIIHSKSYRTPYAYASKNVLVIGNSSSGHDVVTSLLQAAHLPVYVSRRSRSRWEGDTPPPGVVWKPTVAEYLPDGAILFSDGSILTEIDAVIYCTGYKPSFPFWNSKVNGRTLWDYQQDRLIGSYQHTFFRDYPTLGIVGLPRVLTFRSFEYQAVALARAFSGRNAVPLPSEKEMVRWERDRESLVTREGRRFHDILYENAETNSWENGETMVWFQALYDLAGLPLLGGGGRCPPILGEETRWAIEHLRKYPDPDQQNGEEKEWEMVQRAPRKDLLHFI